MPELPTRRTWSPASSPIGHLVLLTDIAGAVVAVAVVVVAVVVVVAEAAPSWELVVGESVHDAASRARPTSTIAIMARRARACVTTGRVSSAVVGHCPRLIRIGAGSAGAGLVHTCRWPVAGGRWPVAGGRWLLARWLLARWPVAGAGRQQPAGSKLPTPDAARQLDRGTRRRTVNRERQASDTEDGQSRCPHRWSPCWLTSGSISRWSADLSAATVTAYVADITSLLDHLGRLTGGAAP